MRKAFGFLLLHFASVSTFAPMVRHPCSAHSTNKKKWDELPRMVSADDDGEEEPKLVLTADDISQQMNRLRSKYPTSEADYLAAARARNVAKQASSERTATDADWRQIAAEKKTAVGEIDDWENSAKEAGNVDSQILIPVQSSSGTGEDGEEEEPKLMLF